MGFEPGTAHLAEALLQQSGIRGMKLLVEGSG